MTSLLIKFLANAAALAAAVWLLDNITLGEEGASTANQAGTLAIVALIFGAVNLVVKPIVRLLALPLLVLTLGLFTLVINALMLMLTSWVAGDTFHVEGFWTAVLGGLIISVVSWGVNTALDSDRS